MQGRPLSSCDESVDALEILKPERRMFSFREILAIPYRSDAFQDFYFVDDLAELVRKTSAHYSTELVEWFCT